MSYTITFSKDGDCTGVNKLKTKPMSICKNPDICVVDGETDLFCSICPYMDTECLDYYIIPTSGIIQFVDGYFGSKSIDLELQLLITVNDTTHIVKDLKLFSPIEVKEGDLISVSTDGECLSPMVNLKIEDTK